MSVCIDVPVSRPVRSNVGAEDSACASLRTESAADMSLRFIVIVSSSGELSRGGEERKREAEGCVSESDRENG